MPSGQTQKVYGHNEKVLAPESIGDIHRMLGESRLTSQIRNYKIVSGVMFFELSRAQWISRRGGYTTYFRYHMVAGEDPNEKGCLVSMHLSPVAQYLITLHMSVFWDTRGGIPNVAWCSAFQFKRKIFPSGTNSRSYTAIRRARRDYCKDLLKSFDDSKAFENQDWQAVRVCRGPHTPQYLADKTQNVIKGRKELFEDCRCEQCRAERHEAREDGGDGHDDDPDTGPDHNRPDDFGLDDDDDDDSNDNPGPHPGHNDNDGGDDDDNDDDDGFDWRHERDLLRRHDPLNSEVENNEDDMLDHGRDLMNMEDAMNEDYNMVDDTNDSDETHSNRYHDRSQSPTFVPHSRQTSPETTDPVVENGHNDDMFDIDLGDISDIEPDGTSDMNIARRTRSPTMPESPVRPKIEPKLEPEAEITNDIGNTRSTRTYDLIDLTEDDESTSSGSSIMEVIELTEDSGTNVVDSDRTINRYEAMIDLTEDWDTSQDGLDMEVIDLDDD
jgi:hypothetical protein